MVLYVQGVPALAGELVLPIGKGPLHLPKTEGQAEHVRHEAVRLHVGKGYHLVQHLALTLSDVLKGDVGVGERTLSHGEAVVILQHLIPKLLQIAVDLRPVGEIFHAVGYGQPGVGVGQARSLGDEGDHVLPEAVHPHIQPEAENVLYLGADLGIVHVQIRLLFFFFFEIVFV